MTPTEQELKRFRTEIRHRRAWCISIMLIILIIFVGVTVLAFPSWRLFGIPKLTWAPPFYLLIFALFVSIAFIWRCPLCRGQLGKVFGDRFCPKCGARFDDSSADG